MAGDCITSAWNHNHIGVIDFLHIVERSRYHVRMSMHAFAVEQKRYSQRELIRWQRIGKRKMTAKHAAHLLGGRHMILLLDD